MIVENHGDPAGFPWSEHFENMLRQRAAVGGPIKKIKILHSTESEEYINVFEDDTTPPDTNISEYMEGLARRLGVRMETRELVDPVRWGSAWTVFSFEYEI